MLNSQTMLIELELSTAHGDWVASIPTWSTHKLRRYWIGAEHRIIRYHVTTITCSNSTSNDAWNQFLWPTVAGGLHRVTRPLRHVCISRKLVMCFAPIMSLLAALMLWFWRNFQARCVSLMLPAAFVESRGHPIEREAYVTALHENADEWVFKFEL